MLSVTTNKFDSNGNWQLAIDSMLFKPLAEDFELFDQNGFDLCPLEKRYAYANQTEYHNHREHRFSLKHPWFQQPVKIEGAVLNHSYLFERKGYVDAAQEQLMHWSITMPLCHKLLALRPKWGLDFSMDWVDRHSNAFEVLHWEYDGFDFEEVNGMRQIMLNVLSAIDWDDAGRRILAHKNEWHHLNFFEQSHWKCRFFNIPDERFKMVAWQ